jgi:hypothetical protein
MCSLTNLAVALCLTTLVSTQLDARDDGRFANSPLKPWFDRLASGKGLCCSFADGFSVAKMDFTDTLDSSKMTPYAHRRHATKRMSQPDQALSC